MTSNEPEPLTEAESLTEPRTPWSRLLWWNTLFHGCYLLRSISLDIWRSRNVSDVPFEELKFGETPLGVVREVLKLRPVGAGERLLDLGCGRGRAAFLFHFLTDAEVTGVDLVAPFISTARRLANWTKCDHRVFFEVADMRVMDLRNFDLIYACAACMGESNRKLMAAKIAQEAKTGASLITVGWRPRYEGLQLENQFRGSFSWGKATVYLSRVSTEPPLETQ